LDALVGGQVAEVIVKNLQSHIGRDDGSWLRKEKPQLGLHELVKVISEWDRMAGIRATQATVVESEPNSVVLEVSNPAVKGSTGAAKAFLFAWWAGVVSSLLGTDFDYANVVYDEAANVMRCQIVPRGTI
jgi:hypothetical protein